MNTITDVDWGKRMELLLDLMHRSPHTKMRKLQWEALKYYPLYYVSSIRNWMSTAIAFKAADLLNEQEGLNAQLRGNLS